MNKWCGFLIEIHSFTGVKVIYLFKIFKFGITYENNNPYVIAFIFGIGGLETQFVLAFRTSDKTMKAQVRDAILQAKESIN